MIWLLSLLVIFWKPVYYLVRYAIALKSSDDINKEYFLGEFKTWFGLFWVLIKPATTPKEEAKP